MNNIDTHERVRRRTLIAVSLADTLSTEQVKPALEIFDQEFIDQAEFSVVKFCYRLQQQFGLSHAVIQRLLINVSRRLFID